MSERIQGWLYFSASKNQIKFVNVDPNAAQDDVPWEIFEDSESESLLWNFIEDFKLKRERSPETVFCYYVDCEHSAINDWLRERVEVIDVPELVGDVRRLA